MPAPASTAPAATLQPTELGGFAPGVFVAPESAQLLCLAHAVTNAAPAPPRSTQPTAQPMWELPVSALPVCGVWSAARCAASAIDRWRTPGARRAVLPVGWVREVSSSLAAAALASADAGTARLTIP